MLKENRHYWSIKEVIEATNRVQARMKNERLSDELEKKLEEFSEHEATLEKEDCGMSDMM